MWPLLFWGGGSLKLNVTGDFHFNLDAEPFDLGCQVGFGLRGDGGAEVGSKPKYDDLIPFAEWRNRIAFITDFKGHLGSIENATHRSPFTHRNPPFEKMDCSRAKYLGGSHVWNCIHFNIYKKLNETPLPSKT
jgi:hypothetical protein